MRLVLSFFFVSLLFPRIGCSSACPRIFPEWKAQLKQFANNLIPELGNNALYVKGPGLLPAKKYQEVLEFWNRCNSKSTDRVKLLYKNILKHSKFMAKAQAPGHAGFAVSDKDYLLQSAGENINYAQLPKVFFKEGYLPEHWKKTVKGCKKNQAGSICEAIKNWSFVDFQSTLEDGSGHHRRVIVQVPHQNYQQYLLFFPEHPKHKESKLVDIIALKTHNERSGKNLEKKEIFFFERDVNGFAVDGGRCVSCHGSGLREVHPIQGSVVSQSQFKKINTFNSKVKDFSKINWKGVFDSSALGPPMGESCLKCHGGEGERGPITIFTKPSLIRSKIQELEMPYSKVHSWHHKSLQLLRETENLKVKEEALKIALSAYAKPGEDYRAVAEVRTIRLKLHSLLRDEGMIASFKYFLIRAVERIMSIHIDYKLNRFFEDHKIKLKDWLEGEAVE